MGAMTKRIILALAVAALVALGSLSPRQATAAGATPPAATAPAAVLYRADRSAGVGGWTVFPGFAAGQGALTFDGKSDSGAFAPFSVAGLTSFAVEATIKVGVSATPAQAYYELFARRASPRTITGLFAGYAANGGEKAATNVASLYWFTDRQPYYAPGAAYQPDGGFHTYRLEVQGDAYRLLIDGREMVPWTVVTLGTPGDRVGLVFTYIPAVVKSFAVYALHPTPAAAALDTRAFTGHVLTTRDIPFPADRAVFRDNARYALDTKLDLAAVRRTGRLYGYYQGFENRTTYVEQSVNLHQSPAGAQAAFALFAGRVQQSAGQYQGYHAVSLAGGQIGDERFAFEYWYLSQGSPSYVLKVLFRRGSYYVGITVDSADQGTTQTAIAYARRADALLQGTGTTDHGTCVVC